MPPLTLPLPAPLRGGRPSDARRRGRLVTLAAFALALLLAALALALAIYRSSPNAARARTAVEEHGRCGGIQGLELWGPAVNWGSDHRLPSAAACCASCRASRRCDSWVFCGDRRRCGYRFGECWLKKQADAMAPSVIARGEDVMWTSGLVFGESQGVVGLETSAGTLHIQLLPDCAPHSVDYFIELLGLHNCAGCRFYRAEGRGYLWDAKGNHVKKRCIWSTIRIAARDTGSRWCTLQGDTERRVLDGEKEDPWRGLGRGQSS